MNTGALDNPVAALALATPGARPRGGIRERHEDFRVDEVLGFEPDGTGEHVLLQIEKRGVNSGDAALSLSRHADVPLRDVGYCGLKDRHATTVQWFSIGLPGRAEPDWAALSGDALKILRIGRHRRKLRRGSHLGNRFVIRVRGIDMAAPLLGQRLATVSRRGVPNYFGEQRFGRHNLHTALRLFEGGLPGLRRQQRSMALSAARSHLFNVVLSRRVADKNWDRLLPGDVANLHGNRSVFAVTETTDELIDRAARQDLHPTGPLYGIGGNQTTGHPRAVEDEVAQRYSNWCDGLVRNGLRFERRPLRLCPAEFDWRVVGDDLTLWFMLPKGAFATAVLREIVDYQQSAR